MVQENIFHFFLLLNINLDHKLNDFCGHFQQFNEQLNFQ